MQTMLRWTSLVLFSALSLFLIWFGITYASVPDMLSFHAAAVPASAHDDVRPLYLALMKLIGSSSAALGMLGGYVIWGPLRGGATWAASALALVYTGVFATAAITAEELAAATDAPTSWHIMGVLLAITAAAYAAHVVARGISQTHQIN